MSLTTVILSDGSVYPIPTGAKGTWPWAREASLISVAYQQAGDYANALRWRKEYEARAAAYNAIEAGADMEAVVTAGSWLDGPAAIVAYLAAKASEIIDAAAKVPAAAVSLAMWIPIVVLGALAVLAIGFNKKSLRLKV